MRCDLFEAVNNNLGKKERWGNPTHEKFNRDRASTYNNWWYNEKKVKKLINQKLCENLDSEIIMSHRDWENYSSIFQPDVSQSSGKWFFTYMENSTKRIFYYMYVFGVAESKSVRSFSPIDLFFKPFSKNKFFFLILQVLTKKKRVLKNFFHFFSVELAIYMFYKQMELT